MLQEKVTVLRRCWRQPSNLLWFLNKNSSAILHVCHPTVKHPREDVRLHGSACVRPFHQVVYHVELTWNKFRLRLTCSQQHRLTDTSPTHTHTRTHRPPCLSLSPSPQTDTIGCHHHPRLRCSASTCADVELWLFQPPPPPGEIRFLNLLLPGRLRGD